jgi:hypothetical protein
MADALNTEEGYYELRGQKKPKITTRGWEFCVQWKDGTEGQDYQGCEKEILSSVFKIRVGKRCKVKGDFNNKRLEITVSQIPEASTFV